MSTEITIDKIADYEEQTVTIKGWLYARTGKGKLQFLRLRDGTGIVQCVAFRPDLGDEKFEQIKRLTQESSLILTGQVRADQRAPGLPGGFEIGITEVEPHQIADEYPISPKDHGVEFFEFFFGNQNSSAGTFYFGENDRHFGAGTFEPTLGFVAGTLRDGSS